MTSALGTAAYAIDAQMRRFERSAQRVAADGPEVREVVEQMSAEHAVKANAAVVRTTDSLVGALFDIVA
jgi:hypothetical protein